MGRASLHIDRAALLATACALALSCAKDESASTTGDAGSEAAGDSGLPNVAGDAQVGDGGLGGGAGAVSEGGTTTGHCALPGQLQDPTTGFCECPPRLPDACSEGCVDLLHDPQHCGECEASCQPGAGCRAGGCAQAPSEVATLVGCVTPRMLLHDGILYFSDSGAGKISSLSLVDGEIVELVTDQPMQDPLRTQRTSAVAIAGDEIYWSNMGEPALMKVSLSGGMPQRLIELDAPARGLAVGNGTVFFSHHADIFKIPSSGLVVDAGVGVAPPPLECDGATMPPTPGDPVVGASYVTSSNESCIPNGEVAAIALTDSDVVYTVDVHGALSQNSQNGGAHLPLILGDDVGPAREVIAMNATHAFAAGYSSVLKAQLGENAMYEAVVNAVDSGIVIGFTVTDTHVYVASDRGGISRASITPPSDNSLVVSEDLVRDQQSPRWLVHDDTHLYWINSDCRLMSVAMSQ